MRITVTAAALNPANEGAAVKAVSAAMPKEALQEQLLSRTDTDEDFTMSALLELNAYMVSDCSVEKLSDLADSLEDCGAAEYRTLEGESVMGEKYMEYYVDEAAARELVMELFYEPVPDA